MITLPETQSPLEKTGILVSLRQSKLTVKLFTFPSTIVARETLLRHWNWKIECEKIVSYEKDAAFRHRSVSLPCKKQRASLTAAHWDVWWLRNSKGCCYHLPHSELVSSQRQGNPRSSAHFKGQAVKNNPAAHAPDFTAPSFRLLEPDDKFGQTAERLTARRNSEQAMSKEWGSRGIATVIRYFF